MRKIKHGETLVIATHNKGKLVELRDLLVPFGLKAISAADLNLAEPDETATTFIGNAEIKAKAAAFSANLPAMADDSGLCIHALNNQPGVQSARFAKDYATYGEAMTALNVAMQAQNNGNVARFVCALTLAWPDGETASVEGIVQGTIVEQRGQFGFGYDAFFLPDGLDKTFGELTAQEKHGLPPLGYGLSHRAKAFLQLSALYFPAKEG